MTEQEKKNWDAFWDEANNTVLKNNTDLYMHGSWVGGITTCQFVLAPGEEQVIEARAYEIEVFFDKDKHWIEEEDEVPYDWGVPHDFWHQKVNVEKDFYELRIDDGMSVNPRHRGPITQDEINDFQKQWEKQK